MTKALILAAGKGTRLRPLTENTPKCLVTFSGKSLLSYQLAAFKKAGISDIAIATGYQREKIEKLGLRTYFNPNFETTNMVTSLMLAKDFFQDASDDLIISYGDIIYQSKILDKLLASEGEVSVVSDKEWEKLWSCRMENPLKDAESFIFNKSGQILELGKRAVSKNSIQGQYIGLIKVKKSSLKKMIKFYESLNVNKKYDCANFGNMYMTTFLQEMIEAGWQVKCTQVSSGWLEFDTYDDWSIYNRMLNQNTLGEYFQN